MLLLHLPQLILPQRLGVMTSLELSIEARGRVTDPRDWVSYDLDHLEPILDNVVKHCRNLRVVCISITSYSETSIADGPVFPLLDAFYRSIQPREMRIELPETSMKSCPITLQPERHPSEPDHFQSLFDCCRWRCFDEGDGGPQVQWRHVMPNYPAPPFKTLTAEDRSRSVPSGGYWVRANGPAPRPRSQTLF